MQLIVDKSCLLITAEESGEQVITTGPFRHLSLHSGNPSGEGKRSYTTYHFDHVNQSPSPFFRVRMGKELFVTTDRSSISVPGNT